MYRLLNLEVGVINCNVAVTSRGFVVVVAFTIVLDLLVHGKIVSSTDADTRELLYLNLCGVTTLLVPGGQNR
jgi:uncharacterized membrane protein